MQDQRGFDQRGLTRDSVASLAAFTRPAHSLFHLVPAAGFILVALEVGEPTFALWICLSFLVEIGAQLYARAILKEPSQLDQYFKPIVAITFAIRVNYGAVFLWMITSEHIEMRWAGACMFVLITVYLMAHLPIFPTIAVIDVATLSLSLLGALIHYADQFMNLLTLATAALLWATVSAYFAFTSHYHHRRRVIETDMGTALLHASKIDTLGQMSSGVAHDLNNMLTVIAGNLDLEELSDTAADKAAFRKEAREAIDRCAGLVQKLLVSSRRSSLSIEAVEIGGFLSDFEKLIRHLLPENIALVMGASDPALPAVSIDRSQLEAALLNLVVNGRDAMAAQGGTLSIEATSVDHAIARRGQHLGAQPCLQLSVADTGHGMSEEMLQKVMEAFVTTKPKGHGTGMGLTIVRNFADVSNGDFLLTSVEGEGTRASLYLPL